MENDKVLVSGSFAWWHGYLLLKPDKGKIEDIPAFLSPEPDVCLGKIVMNSIELMFYRASEVIPGLPKEYEDYQTIIRMTTKAFCFPADCKSMQCLMAAATLLNNKG